MIDNNTWDMILGKAGKLPGELGSEIISLAEKMGKDDPMEKKVISEIMEKYTDGELTAEEANEQLCQQGAGFHLVPLTEAAARAKREREHAEGFLLPNEDGVKPLPKTPDMRRRRDLAGQVVIQQVRSGCFAVSCDENGYAGKARRVTFAN